MAKWLSRGLVLTTLMVGIRLVQGALINRFESAGPAISLTVLALFALVVLIWGYVDGRADARVNPDPDRRDDLAMTWLLAGLLTGFLSGVVSWLISLVYPALFVAGLFNELTSFAAFTALLTFIPAILGVAVGRWLVDRNAPEVERRHGDEDRADTDVFAAVRDDSPTGEIPVATAAAEGDSAAVQPRTDQA